MAPGLMDVVRGLFGGGEKKVAGLTAAEPVEHKGYMITPMPRADKGVWYVAGSISLTGEEGTREQYFIRADSSADRDQTIDLTVAKAKQIIDMEGERMFDRGSDPAAAGLGG